MVLSRAERGVFLLRFGVEVGSRWELDPAFIFLAIGTKHWFPNVFWNVLWKSCFNSLIFRNFCHGGSKKSLKKSTQVVRDSADGLL